MAAPTVNRPPSPPTAPPPDAAPTAPARRPPRSRSARWTRWSRLVHVYTSMLALLVVLFFGLTGITLNHPDWTFGDEVETSSSTGTLPFATTLADGSVDFLSVAEHVRAEDGVKGNVSDFGVTGDEGTIAFADPGYAATVTFDVGDGTYEVRVEQQGWVAVVNDLHKGRDTGPAWRWVIDVAAGFLVVVALSGLAMQLFLTRRRRAALAVAGIGAVAVVAVMVATLG